jgi:hypothetical protein
MEQYISKDAVLAEIERRKKYYENIQMIKPVYESNIEDLSELHSFLDNLEMKEVDLEKLGEIARHLIAVKEHIEDMRLDKEEWFMLEKIGYPERFIKAQKGE